MSDSQILLGGRYEIGRLLGRGGMAEVYLAQDTRLHRTVAVKVLRSELALDEHFQERFRREAQSAASLNHPSIVGVYDTGEDHRTEANGEQVTIPFIVMEYVDGDTLRSYISTDNPMSEQRAAKVMSGVLSALEYSHRAGIVHRDIKPGNIMITKQGEVKVMDFGIARAIAEATSAMTQTQAVMGTAQYLSPEQARGQQVDARSDVYSAAVVLYELLTGRPPFTGDSPVSIAYQHVRENPLKPSTFNPNITPAMDAVVVHGLTKDRDYRYQSAADFSRDINAVAAGHEPQVLSAVGAAGVGAADAATQVLSANDYPTEVFQDQATQMIPTHTTPLAPVAAPTAVATAEPRTVVEADDDSRGKILAWILGALALLAVLAVAAWWFIGQQSSSSPSTVAVPNVVGLTADEAKSKLVASNLKADIQEAASDQVEQGKVVSTDPGADAKVAPGSTVHVVVSAGSSTVAVPNLVGKTSEEAQAELKKAGFTATVAGNKDIKGVEKNKVGETEPAAGTSAKRGSEVKIWLSSGRVQVPTVTGLSQDEATKSLEAAGFKVQVATREAASGETVGNVVEQSPAGQQSADSGSDVRIVVATGAGPVTVPNLAGRTLEEAQAEFSKQSIPLGFTVTHQNSDTVEKGRVIGTDPAANSQVAANSTITIIVSDGPAATASPTATPSASATATPPGNTVTTVPSATATTKG